ncbi:MAG TPA: TetR/AcrR family transcriptional regulator [Allosphingosinicella sp.]|jgi:AcrR family transcriptional regulator
MMQIKETKREAQRRDRRETILRAARASFLEQGYAATTMSAIAAALGGSKTTLWTYFPSKEELFAAVIDDAIVQFRQELLAILDLSGGIEETLRRFSVAILTKMLDPDTIRLHRIIAAEAERFPEVGRIFYERAPRQTQERLAAYLSEAMGRGELRQADPLIAAQQLVVLLQAQHYLKRVWNVVPAVEPDEIRADVETAIDTFLRAYGAPAR